MHMPMVMHGKKWDTSNARDIAHRATEAKMSAPWAVLGMAAAFAGGTLLGIAGSKKSMQTSSEDKQRWMSMKHHHHGFGESACRHKHGAHEMAAPGAREEESDRNEGE